MNKRKLEIFVDTHLQLCEACVSDAGTIYRAIDLHRDDLRRWLPFVDGLHSVAEEKNFLSGTGCYRNFAGGASCLVVLRDCVYGRSMSGR